MEDVIELGAGGRLALRGEDRRDAAVPGQGDWASKLQWSMDMVAARLWLRCRSSNLVAYTHRWALSLRLLPLHLLCLRGVL